MNTAKVFQTGRSQAVRLPKEFRFDSTEVKIEKRGRQVILSPLDTSWNQMVSAIHAVPNDAKHQQWFEIPKEKYSDHKDLF